VNRRQQGAGGLEINVIGFCSFEMHEARWIALYSPIKETSFNSKNCVLINPLEQVCLRGLSILLRSALFIFILMIPVGSNLGRSHSISQSYAFPVTLQLCDPHFVRKKEDR
jgi:hypothetical protein